MEEMHQQKVEQMIKSAEGSAAKLLRCTLLNGSAWSTERKVHEKIQRKVRYLLWD